MDTKEQAMDEHSEDRGPWSQTFTGAQFHHRAPRPASLRVEDIAHALALQCRFGGHCREPYSLAEHSVRVSRCAVALAIADGVVTMEVERGVAFEGLMHDAAEAYVVDVPRPVKGDLGDAYRHVERVVDAAIRRRFGVWSWGPYVHRADEILLATEARDLMVWPPPADWELRETPLAERITPWPWAQAEREFLAAFYELSGGARG